MYERVKGIYLVTRKTDQDNGEPIYYVGQADNIFDRLNAHCTTTAPTTRIDKAIKKYGSYSFSFDVLAEVTEQENRDLQEREFIHRYIQKYGEKLMYNTQSGGKRGSTVINNEARRFDAEIKKKIRAVFEVDVSYSIYLIAEHYGLQWTDVRDVRKPFLKKHNLRYDSDQRKVVFVESSSPPDNWHGYVLTRNQVDVYLSKKDELDKKDLASVIGVSVIDLEREFIPAYSEGDYRCAEDVCDINILV